MSDILVCDRPADDCYSTATRPAWNAWKGVSWEMLASHNPCFGTPGKRACEDCRGTGWEEYPTPGHHGSRAVPSRHGCSMCGGKGSSGPSAIPLRPAIVMAERCVECGGSGGGQKPARYEHEDPYHETCDTCSGTGLSGRVGAREVRVFAPRQDEALGRITGNINSPVSHWSLAITDDVTREDCLPEEPTTERHVNRAAWRHLKSLGIQAARFAEQSGALWPIAWRGLALVDGALYVVGVVAAGELPEGGEWLEWVPDPAGGIKVGTKGLGWWNRHPSDFDPFSRALCPELGRVLGG